MLKANICGFKKRRGNNGEIIKRIIFKELSYKNGGVHTIIKIIDFCCTTWMNLSQEGKERCIDEIRILYDLTNIDRYQKPEKKDIKF